MAVNEASLPASLLEPLRIALRPRRRKAGRKHGLPFTDFRPARPLPPQPSAGYTPPPDANTHTYRKMAETLGIERTVIVNPTPYDTDHQCTIDSLELFGRKRAKGVAVAKESFTQAALED